MKMLDARLMKLEPWVERAFREQLARGERKLISCKTTAPPKTNLKPASSFYWDAPFASREAGHEQVRAAVRAGAIDVAWADQGGEERPLDWIRVKDVAALASILGERTNDAKLQEASSGLQQWAVHPRVVEILHEWRSLRSVRGSTPEHWADWRDALLVLDALAARAGQDVVLRVLSGDVFGDTKRAEHLVRHLDALTSETLTSRPREMWEVLNSLGLVKQPQAMMIAGTGAIRMTEGPAATIAQPYIGISPAAIAGLESEPAWVMTVENLTTFHLAAEQLQGRVDGLIVYTGGMPSPAWVRGFHALTASLPATTMFYHWGDIDAGGFRIAAHIQLKATPNHQVAPWMMDATAITGCARASTDTRDAMRQAAVRAGWHCLAELPGLLIEQERLPVVLPRSAGRTRHD